MNSNDSYLKCQTKHENIYTYTDSFYLSIFEIIATIYLGLCKHIILEKKKIRNHEIWQFSSKIYEALINKQKRSKNLLVFAP